MPLLHIDTPWPAFHPLYNQARISLAPITSLQDFVCALGQLGATHVCVALSTLQRWVAPVCPTSSSSGRARHRPSDRMPVLLQSWLVFTDFFPIPRLCHPCPGSVSGRYNLGMTTIAPRRGIGIPHWGWFALATVALVVAALALSVWLPYYREQQIVQKIERLGGAAFMENGRPKWLRELVGDKRIAGFDRVDCVSLHRSQVTEEDLAQLSSLTRLTWLDLTGASVTDAGLARLAGLTSLAFLDLSGTSVSDAGIAHLRSLANLEGLSLGETKVTDAGLAHLTGLTNLESLDLSKTKVTDTGNTCLARMKQLRSLNVTKNLISLEGVETLQKALPNCQISYCFGFP
jgi:Leucine rich repeat